MLEFVLPNGLFLTQYKSTLIPAEPPTIYLSLIKAAKQEASNLITVSQS